MEQQDEISARDDEENGESHPQSLPSTPSSSELSFMSDDELTALLEGSIDPNGQPTSTTPLPSPNQDMRITISSPTSCTPISGPIFDTSHMVPVTVYNSFLPYVNPPPRTNFIVNALLDLRTGELVDSADIIPTGCVYPPTGNTNANLTKPPGILSKSVNTTPIDNVNPSTSNIDPALTNAPGTWSNPASPKTPDSADPPKKAPPGRRIARACSPRKARRSGRDEIPAAYQPSSSHENGSREIPNGAIRSANVGSASNPQGSGITSQHIPGLSLKNHLNPEVDMQGMGPGPQSEISSPKIQQEPSNGPLGLGAFTLQPSGINKSTQNSSSGSDPTTGTSSTDNKDAENFLFDPRWREVVGPELGGIKTQTAAQKEIKDAQAKHDKEMKAAKKNFDNYKEESEKRLADLIATYDKDIETAKKEGADKAEASYEKQLSAMKASHDKELKKAKQSGIDSVKEWHEKEWSAWLSSRDKELKKAKQSGIDSFKEWHEKEWSALKASQDKELEKAKQDGVNSVKEWHEKELSAMKASHDKELKTAKPGGSDCGKESYEKELAAMKASHDKELKTAKQDGANSAKEEYEKIYEKKLSDLDAQYDKELEAAKDKKRSELVAQYDKELKTAEDKSFSDLNAQYMLELKAAKAQKSSELDAQYNKEFEAAKQTVTDSVREDFNKNLEKAFSDMKKSHTKETEKSNQDFVDSVVEEYEEKLEKEKNDIYSDFKNHMEKWWQDGVDHAKQSHEKAISDMQAKHDAGLEATKQSLSDSVKESHGKETSNIRTSMERAEKEVEALKVEVEKYQRNSTLLETSKASLASAQVEIAAQREQIKQESEKCRDLEAKKNELKIENLKSTNQLRQEIVRLTSKLQKEDDDRPSAIKMHNLHVELGRAIRERSEFKKKVLDSNRDWNSHLMTDAEERGKFQDEISRLKTDSDNQKTSHSKEIAELKALASEDRVRYRKDVVKLRGCLTFEKCKNKVIEEDLQNLRARSREREEAFEIEKNTLEYEKRGWMNQALKDSKKALDLKTKEMKVALARKDVDIEYITAAATVHSATICIAMFCCLILLRLDLWSSTQTSAESTGGRIEASAPTPFFIRAVSAADPDDVDPESLIAEEGDLPTSNGLLSTEPVDSTSSISVIKPKGKSRRIPKWKKEQIRQEKEEANLGGNGLLAKPMTSTKDTSPALTLLSPWKILIYILLLISTNVLVVSPLINLYNRLDLSIPSFGLTSADGLFGSQAYSKAYLTNVVSFTDSFTFVEPMPIETPPVYIFTASPSHLNFWQQPSCFDNYSNVPDVLAGEPYPRYDGPPSMADIHNCMWEDCSDVFPPSTGIVRYLVLGVSGCVAVGTWIATHR